MNVREILPQRRSNPTNKPKGKNWSKHKPDLREDFHHHCGYCGSYDGFRHTYFEVDHFIPKSLFKKNRNISYCQYDNLVYSCKFCNNKKGSKWPSKNETIPIFDGKGFIDPCNKDYDSHLYRTKDGGILWRTELGKWMVQEAFKFDERDYAIKLLWELNQRRKLLDRFIVELSNREEQSEEYRLIRNVATEISFEYYSLNKDLIIHYNNL